MTVPVGPREPSAPRSRETDTRLAAIATTDPLDERTFSGYSAALFSHLAALGAGLVPISSRQVRVRDVLHGAIRPRGILRGRPRSRRSPVISPDWYWSPPVLERLSARVNTRLAVADGVTHALQIGTHVLVDHPGVRSFCVTDCTVAQAVEAGEFAISRASSKGVAQAFEWQRRVFDSCETIFTTSRWAAASVVDDYGQSPGRVHTIGAGATNVGVPATPAADDAPPTALFVGIDWDLKGGPLLVDAWQQVRAAIPEARLVIVGSAPEFVDAGVVIVGRLDPRVASDRARLIDAYASADCLVLVSDFDAFPNVVLEAGAMGTPTVAFDEQSRREVVIDGETGVLVADHDVGSVAEGLIALLANRPKARALGANARRRIESEYTWDRVAARVAADMGLS